MPFPERNPPNLPILPGPDFRCECMLELLKSVLVQSWITEHKMVARYLNSVPPTDKGQFHKGHSLGWKNGLRFVSSSTDVSVATRRSSDMEVCPQGPVCQATRDRWTNPASWTAAPRRQEPAGGSVRVGRHKFESQIDWMRIMSLSGFLMQRMSTGWPRPLLLRRSFPNSARWTKRLLWENLEKYLQRTRPWCVHYIFAQVLRFFGHFSEEIPAGVGSEGSRVRNVQVSPWPALMICPLGLSGMAHCRHMRGAIFSFLSF